MPHYSLPRFFTAYVWLLPLAVFGLLFKVPFAFSPPAQELRIVMGFIFESWHILFELFRYIAALVLIYALLVYWAFVLTRATATRLQMKHIVVFALFTLCFVWIFLALLIANYAFNPISGFDWLVPPQFRTIRAGWIAASMWLALGALHGYALRPRKPGMVVFVILLVALPACWFATGAVREPEQAHIEQVLQMQEVAKQQDAVKQQAGTSGEPQSATGKSVKPNIIIIGVDSFTPKHFQRYGDYIKPLWNEVAPAHIFSDSVATVPRTYPSWASILSGQYSIRNGMRFNLMPRERDLSDDQLLSRRFQAQGYRTVFAMDERLFANYDESFGFDEVYGPPVGAADMALSGASDHPIVNLLGHLPVLGRLLFPHTYANRPAAKTYYPEEFFDLLKQGLAQKDERPVFLVAHFCLAHWPYYWGERFTVPAFQNSLTGEIVPNAGGKEPYHAAAVRRVGIEVAEFIQFLREHGYLDNSVLVLLSDHGENLKTKEKIKLNPGDKVGRVFSDAEFNLMLNRTNAGFNGHGVNVYDDWQNQVMLGFRGFGANFDWIKQGESQHPTSLIDVAPTLLEVAGVPFDPKDFDGTSLVKYMKTPGMADENAKRFRIVETDLIIRSMEDINKIDIAAVVKEGISFYQVTPDGRVELKPKVIDEQLPTKVRSVYYGDWVLSVSAPIMEFPSFYVLLNRNTGKWTDELDSDFAKEAPVAEMMAEMVSHYKSEFPDKSKLSVEK